MYEVYIIPGTEYLLVQGLAGTQASGKKIYLSVTFAITSTIRGAIVIRTDDVPKNPYIPALDTILGPDHCVPP